MESFDYKLENMNDDQKDRHFNRIKAEKYIGKNPEVMKQFAALIRSEIEKSISQLQEAIDLKDIHQLKKIGHRLKGATLTAGMQILSECAIRFSEMSSFSQEFAEQCLLQLKEESFLVMEILEREVV